MPPSLSTSITPSKAASALCMAAAIVLLLTVTVFPPHAGAEKASPVPGSDAEHALDIETAEHCPPENTATALQLTGYKTVCIARNSLPEVEQVYAHWEKVMTRHIPERAFGRNAAILTAPEQAQWVNLSKMMPTLSVDKKLQYINGFFNRRASVKDPANYGVDEYWATPEEFLEKGGDCEDFALTKYLALRYFSWPEEDMWVLLVIEKKSEERHAVLATRHKDTIFILDNLSRPAYLLIPEKTFTQNYMPLFAVNSRGVWVFAKDDTQSPPSAGKKKSGNQYSGSR